MHSVFDNGNVCVAQLDRAPDYGSGGLGFESLRERSHLQAFARNCRGFFYEKKGNYTKKGGDISFFVSPIEYFIFLPMIF